MMILSVLKLPLAWSIRFHVRPRLCCRKFLSISRRQPVYAHCKLGIAEQHGSDQCVEMVSVPLESEYKASRGSLLFQTGHTFRSLNRSSVPFTKH